MQGPDWEECFSALLDFVRGDVCEGPAAHPEWGQTLLSLSTCVPGLVNALQSLSSEEPFELVVEIMNPSLVHNESRSRCSKPDFKSNCC